jgi:hypothetical protein
MKINIEIDCSPEEARTFMGLPDVSQANNIYVDQLSKAMKGVSNPDQLQEYAERLAPMGQMGLKLFQSFVESGMGQGGGGARRGSPGANDKDSTSD